MCGIVGIYSQEPVAQALYDSLIHLQHRGQHAAGILTATERFHSKHGLGLVREIFTRNDLVSLVGKFGIAHTRYPTAGGYGESDIQPMWVGNPRGIALAHNGNLVNYHTLAKAIRAADRHLNSGLDSEVLLLTFADYLAENQSANSDEQFFNALCEALQKLFQTIQGAYSVVSLVMGKGLIAFRDPHGIRPLVLGKKIRDNGACDYLFASETTPFYALGFELMGDLQPGEVAFVNLQGELKRRVIKTETFRPCVFEYVYFARPDSTLDGVNVYRARQRMGENLAKAWQKKFPTHIPDVVIPAPFTANTAALSFALTLGVRYSEGLYKNPFIGRTFIMPNQSMRSQQVRYKLTPQRIEIENKSVLILDDSIVRGTTSKEIVKMIREFGAKKIYFAACAPPIKSPCFYGIDLPSERDLIAAQMSEKAIADFLGVDLLLYQSESDLIEAVTRRGNHEIGKPCMGCMTGEYVCGNLTPERRQLLKNARNLEHDV